MDGEEPLTRLPRLGENGRRSHGLLAVPLRLRRKPAEQRVSVPPEGAKAGDIAIVIIYRARLRRRPFRDRRIGYRGRKCLAHARHLAVSNGADRRGTRPLPLGGGGLRFLASAASLEAKGEGVTLALSATVVPVLRWTPSPRFSKFATLTKRNGPPPPRGRERWRFPRFTSPVIPSAACRSRVS